MPLAILVSAGIVWQASTAAFTDVTDNSGNSWATGTVVLDDDDAATAMFNATGLTANSTGTKCIQVSYTGSLAASVKLYGTVSGTGLASYLDLVIEEGTGGNFGGCTGFTPTATIHNGTLAAFGTAATNFSTGIGSFAPTGSGQNMTYRFTYTVQNNNAAQGLNANASFTWEAQG